MLRVATVMAISLLALPALAERPVGMVAPQYQISRSYAKRLVKQALRVETTHNRWSVKPMSFIPRPTPGRPIGPQSYYNAKAKGPFLMHLPVLPNYIAEVNIAKGKSSPRGIERVKLTPLQLRPMNQR